MKFLRPSLTGLIGSNGTEGIDRWPKGRIAATRKPIVSAYKEGLRNKQYNMVFTAHDLRCRTCKTATTIY